MSKLPSQENKRKVKENFWLTKGLRCVLTMTVFGMVAGFVLSLANQITAPIIAVNEHERLMATLEKVMPEADEYKIVSKDGKDIYFGVIIEPEGREVYAAAVPGSGRGFYGDPVEVLTVVNTEGQINEVVVMRQKETPGLGDRILTLEFLTQFEGVADKSTALEQEFGELLIEEVDIITGATISSEAVVEGVAEAITFYTAIPPLD